MSFRTLPMAGGAPGPTLTVRQHPEVIVSLSFVVSGVASLIVGAVVLILWAAEIAPRDGWATPHALALTHVLALGFVSSLAMGVLYHIAPLAFGQRLPAPLAGLAVWSLLVAGLTVFILGLATSRTGWIAIGGGTVAAAVLGFVAHLALVALGARRRYPPTDFQVAAMAAFACVALLGATLALMLHLGAGHDLLTILAVKIILAVGGWLGVLVVGVSYQLVPMFTPSVARPRFLRPVLGLLVAGVLLAALSCLAGAPAWLRIAAAAPYVAGAVLHMADVVRLVAARRDRIVGPVTAGQLCGASLLVVGGLEGCAAMSGAWPWPQVSVVTALLGWAPVLIAANSVRIVPFIVWQGLPRGRRPRTFFPASAHLGWAGVGGALTAWIAMTAAMVTGSSAAARAAGAALLGCSIALAGVSVSTLRGIHGSLTA